MENFDKAEYTMKTLVQTYNLHMTKSIKLSILQTDLERKRVGLDLLFIDLYRQNDHLKK